MGKDLHPQILTFFKARMKEHVIVIKLEDLSSSDDFIFLVKRKESMPDVVVHLSDAYEYGHFDFTQRPHAVANAGSFILVAKPEATFDPQQVVEARLQRIGLGQIGKLMGALNKREVWTYYTAEERQERKKSK